MEAGQPQEKLNISSVCLLNDLAAIAHGVSILDVQDLFVLNQGKAVAGGPLAVIAPSTGLGEAYLTSRQSRYQAYASEGGHADFVPVTPLQLDLLRYLQERYGHVNYE
jgi:glucokinase